MSTGQATQFQKEAKTKVDNQNNQTLRIEPSPTAPYVRLYNTNNSSVQMEFKLKPRQNVRFVCAQYFTVSFPNGLPVQILSNQGAQNGTSFTPQEYPRSNELYRLRLQALQTPGTGLKPTTSKPNGKQYNYSITLADGNAHDPGDSDEAEHGFRGDPERCSGLI